MISMEDYLDKNEEMIKSEIYDLKNRLKILDKELLRIEKMRGKKHQGDLVSLDEVG